MAEQKRDEFVRLVTVHQRELFGYLLALVQNREDALDIQQQTLLTLWRKFDEFEPGTNFIGWAIRVAQLQVLEFRRKNHRRQYQLSQEVLADVADSYVEQQLSGPAHYEALRHCLSLLNESDRQLIRKCYQEGCRVRHVAAEMGRPERSVSNSLRRVRRALLDCVQRTLAREDRS